MKVRLNLRVLSKNRGYLEEENGNMIALQISPKIESLYGLGGQATKFRGFVWKFATFARLPFGQFSTENSQTWLGGFSFSNISVEMLRFSIESIKETRTSHLTFLQWAIYLKCYVLWRRWLVGKANIEKLNGKELSAKNYLHEQTC